MEILIQPVLAFCQPEPPNDRMQKHKADNYLINNVCNVTVMTKEATTEDNGQAIDFNKNELQRVSTKDLMKDQSCLLITHGNSEYLLRVTRSNKLILTK